MPLNNFRGQIPGRATAFLLPITTRGWLTYPFPLGSPQARTFIAPFPGYLPRLSFARTSRQIRDL